MINALEELKEDATVPKNIKKKIQGCIDILQENVELSIRVNKVLHELEEISEDSNMQAYTRTQIWNISSMLERL